MRGGWQKAWRQVRWSVAQRGVWGTVRVVAERVWRRGLRGRDAAKVVVHPFDARYGVETSGFIGGGELAGAGGNDRFITAYHAAPPERFAEAMDRWRGLPGTRAVEDVAFLDVGCGKGRAMMLAAEMGFREVVGVELNAGLVEIAERNLRRWEELGWVRSPVRVVLGDAVEVALPAAPLLVFLYNPFQAPVLRRLLERLEVLAGESVGLIDVVYVVPSAEWVFAEFARFERLWSGVMSVVEDEAASAEDRCGVYRR